MSGKRNNRWNLPQLPSAQAPRPTTSHGRHSKKDRKQTAEDYCKEDEGTEFLSKNTRSNRFAMSGSLASVVNGIHDKEIAIGAAPRRRKAGGGGGSRNTRDPRAARKAASSQSSSILQPLQEAKLKQAPGSSYHDEGQTRRNSDPFGKIPRKQGFRRHSESSSSAGSPDMRLELQESSNANAASAKRRQGSNSSRKSPKNRSNSKPPRSPKTTEEVVDLCDDNSDTEEDTTISPPKKTSPSKRSGDDLVDTPSPTKKKPRVSSAVLKVEYPSDNDKDRKPKGFKTAGSNERLSGSKEVAVVQGILMGNEQPATGRTKRKPPPVAAMEVDVDDPIEDFDSTQASHGSTPAPKSESPLAKAANYIKRGAQSVLGSVGLSLSKANNNGNQNHPNKSLLAGTQPGKRKRATFGRQTRSSKATAIVPGASLTAKATRSSYFDDEDYLPDEEDTYANRRATRSSGIAPIMFYDRGGTQPRSLDNSLAYPAVAKRRTSLRSSSSKKKKTPETIEINDSSDEEENGTNGSRDYDAARIAVGDLVAWSECKVVFGKDSSLELVFRMPPKATKTRKARTAKKKEAELVTHKINLESDVTELKYFCLDENAEADEANSTSGNDEDDQMSFLTLHVKPNESNGLGKYPNKYKPDTQDLLKRYIVVEFRSDRELLELLETMKTLSIMGSFVQDAQLDARKAKLYCKALLDDNKNDAKQRLRSLGSPTSIRKHGFLAGKKDDDVLLVYPFDGDKKLIEEAAEGLNEASANSLEDAKPPEATTASQAASCPEVASAKESADDTTKTTVNVTVESAHMSETSTQDLATTAQSIDTTATAVATATAEANSSESDEKVESETETKKNRAHFLTITVEDYERLVDTEEYLNDTLVDFWMQWITRNNVMPDLHFFSSHFYTALANEGPEGVVKWTKRKGIDIFTKKLIFIPINKSLHWSLCVIVNPGKIMKHRAWAKKQYDKEEREFSDLDPYPCILFFDSLKAHQKKQVRTKVIGWLNSEWKRLGKSTDDPSLKPFNNDALVIWSPRIPYQDNSWDCGVFVCRYAYAMYMLRDKDFSYAEANAFRERGPSPFLELITSGPEFTFGMEDIYRLRDEMKTLIERLSKVYLPWKQERDRKEKEEKAAERQARLDAKEAKSKQVEQSGDLSADAAPKPKDEEEPAKLPMADDALKQRDDSPEKQDSDIAEVDTKEDEAAKPSDVDEKQESDVAEGVTKTDDARKPKNDLEQKQENDVVDLAAEVPTGGNFSPQQSKDDDDVGESQESAAALIQTKMVVPETSKTTIDLSTDREDDHNVVDPEIV